MPEHYALDEFRHRRFPYKRGQHVGFLGRTQFAGKTTLAAALLDSVASPELPATIFCMKSQDRVVSALTRKLGFEETPTWPPRRRLRNWHPRGHTLWPRQSLTDVAADQRHMTAQFDQALLWHQKHTPGIVFADELQGLLVELQLRARLRAVITRAGGAGLGLWWANQKGSGTRDAPIDGYFLNSIAWAFMSKDPVEQNIERYSQISAGIPARDIYRETLKLDPYSWLAVYSPAPWWCVVDAYDPEWNV